MPKNVTKYSDWSAMLPAIAVGGPPHSGKTVLVYSLTQILRHQSVPHYVLRACPDGEGDWSNEASQDLVQAIRFKGDYSPDFIADVVDNLRQRRVPMLVDVGGEPAPWQEVIFDHCTYAILLIGERADDPQAYRRDLAYWTDVMARHRLPVLAQLKSVLDDSNRLDADASTITGVLNGLERRKVAGGPAFDALVRRIGRLFMDATEKREIEACHLREAPVELALHLPRLANTLGSHDGVWQPQQLPDLCERYLPSSTPLALYGRAPTWVYATLAVLAQPADVWLFDTRLGWVSPPTLPVTADAVPTQRGWRVQARQNPRLDAVIIDMGREGQYLSIDRPEQLPLPAIASGTGVILSGPVPFWLMTAAARQYASHSRWLGVYYPQLQGAVVVHSKDRAHPLGATIPV